MKQKLKLRDVKEWNYSLIPYFEVENTGRSRVWEHCVPPFPTSLGFIPLSDIEFEIPKKFPEPPEGYRLATEDDKKSQKPENTIYFSKQYLEWCPSLDSPNWWATTIYAVPIKPVLPDLPECAVESEVEITKTWCVKDKNAEIMVYNQDRAEARRRFNIAWNAIYNGEQK